MGIGELAEVQVETSEAVINTSNTTNSTAGTVTEFSTTSLNQRDTSVGIAVETATTTATVLTVGVSAGVGVAGVPARG